jgi:hypothetical protein
MSLYFLYPHSSSQLLRTTLTGNHFFAVDESLSPVLMLTPLPENVDGGLIIRDKHGKPTGAFLFFESTVFVDVKPLCLKPLWHHRDIR